MAEIKTDDLRKDVNLSGFPFQRKIEHLINSTTSEHGWKVETREHAWQDNDPSAGGFIDLVVRHESYILKIIIECKRPRDGRWIFLTDKASAPSQRVRTLWSYERLRGWNECFCEPSSVEASDCIIRGQDKQSPMLERIADDLLMSMYAVSLQEEKTFAADQRVLTRIYLPMIVTAAELFVCRADAANDISMDGSVTESAEFASIPFARFRKSLATQLNEDANPRTLMEENLDKERTILVVNGSDLTAVLQRLVPVAGFPQPWNGFRF